MAKTFVGIDIGKNSIRAAVCDGPLVRGIHTALLPEGLMADDRIVSYDAMADFIKQTVSALPVSAKNAAFVIPASGGITRTLHVPAMTEKELALNLPYEFKDYIFEGKDKYVYDYAVLASERDAGGMPVSMDLMAVAAKKETIEEYTAMFSRAGLKLRVALPRAAALQNLMNYAQNAPASCCIIDFSYEDTQLHFFKGRRYDVSRGIDAGISNIVDVVALEQGVDEHIAREYVRSNFEGCLDSAQVKQAYGNIAVEVGRAISFFTFNNPDTAIEAVYFGGEGSRLDDLLVAVGSHIDIPLQDVAVLMPPAQGKPELRSLCPAAVGATMGR